MGCGAEAGLLPPAPNAVSFKNSRPGALSLGYLCKAVEELVQLPGFSPGGLGALGPGLWGSRWSLPGVPGSKRHTIKAQPAWRCSCLTSHPSKS